MNSVSTFRVKDYSGELPILFVDTDGLEAEKALLERLETLPRGATLQVDFSGVRVASSAAKTILRRALSRIMSGEVENRSLVLTGIDESRYNIESMLQREGFTVVERRPDGTAVLFGKIDPAVEETYDFVLRKPRVTASEVRQTLGTTSSTATNRLTKLAELGLARKVGQEILPAGGRQHVYEAVK